MLKGMVRAAAVLLALASVRVHAESCIWIAGERAIHQVDASSIQITRSLALPEPTRLAMNAADCGVWVLSGDGDTLRHYSDRGVLTQDIALRALQPRLDDVQAMVLDPYDESLWLADERRLIHVSSAGQLLVQVVTPGKIRRIQIALDQSLWLLGKNALWHLDRQGALLGAFTLGRERGTERRDRGDTERDRHDSEGERDELEVRQLAVDSVAGLVWLVGEREVLQTKLSAPDAPVLRLGLPQPIKGFALDPLKGNVWLTQRDLLLAYGRDGALVASVDLRPLGIGKAETLAFDPASRSLWLESESMLGRFSDSGQFAGGLRLRQGEERGEREGERGEERRSTERDEVRTGEGAVGVPAFQVQPTLALIRPPQNALTNNPRLPFTLAYDALCNAQPCGFGGDYLGRYSLSATLNSQPVGQLFVFDPNSKQANFTPALRLPEGINTFMAQAQDPFGHKSNSVTNRFTVDTIPPKFLTLTPPEGSTFAAPNVVISGTIDKPGTTVVLSGSGMTQTGTSFGFAVVLQPGLNTFVLSATDPAGNVATATLHLVLATVSITVTSPINGASVASDRVIVSGTLQGPTNTGVTVNGIPATVSGNTFIAVDVPLQLGANTLTTIATTPNRQTATQTLNVTSTGPGPIQVFASPAQGLAPFDVTFTINNRTGRALSLVKADFTGTGTFFSYPPTQTIPNRYPAPGIYQAQFVVTDTTGANYNQTVTVVVQDPAQIDQMLRAIWGGFTQALIARDKTRALQYLNTQAQGRYGPVFDALLPQMPQIVASYSAPQTGLISDALGEYAINRTVSGVNRIFFIYFVKDVDGVWRIDSM